MSSEYPPEKPPTIFSPGGRRSRPGENWWYLGGRAVCNLVCTFLLELKSYGRENLPRTGGVLLISNHQSYLDPVILGIHMHRPIGFLAKAELFENRYFGGLIRRFNAFPVRRGEGDIAAIREVLRRLKEGHVVTLFPEGTRSRDGNLKPIQSGIAMIVRRAGVPVVPAVITGSFNSWPPNQKLPCKTKAAVIYGPALKIEKLKGDQIVKLIEQTFAKMMAELKEKR